MDTSEALALTRKLHKKLANRGAEVRELDEYAEGKQPLAFASREWAEFHKDRYVGFSDNWCSPVASAPAERLKWNGFTLPKGGQKAAARRLWEDCQRNDLDAQSSQGFLESIIAKRSYTIVWGDDDDTPEFTWEHPSEVIVEYEPGNARKKIAALKAWRDEEWEYATLYEPGALWKWRRQVASIEVKNGRTAGGLQVVSTTALDFGGDWEPYHPSSDDTWPLDNPLNEVNVVEWPNRPRLGNEPVSDIAGTKAMQDAINLLWAYLFGAADHASMPGRVITGQEPPKLPILDENGQKIGEKAVDMKELQHGRFLWLTGQNAKISEYSAAKLDVFTAVIEIAVGHVAAQTRTPSHYLINANDVPAAGYELAEAGLVKKCEEFQLFSSAPARDHLRLMAKVRGDEKLAEALRLASISWANPAIRSDSQLSDALLKKRQTGYPLEYILEKDGLGPSEVERVMAMIQREQEDPYLTRLGEKADGADADTDAPERG